MVDVGGEYEDAKKRYDHHQRTFNTTFPGHATKLSSAGLVYMHYGKAIISQHTGLPIDHADTELLYEKLYTDFVEALDANDNGVSVYEPSELANSGLKKRFKDFGVTLASMVGDLNHPDPTDPSTFDSVAPAEKPQAVEDARFANASKFMGSAFMRKLHGAANSWLPARTTVFDAYKNRFSVHPSGQLMVLPKAGVPWKEHLYNAESADAESTDANNVIYVLYSENEDPLSKWRVQAVSKTADSFESRKALPEAWRGVRDSELDAVLGDDIEDGAVFVHASGFIGGHKTGSGAKKMASKALEL